MRRRTLIRGALAGLSGSAALLLPRFYRFLPATWGDLSVGALQVLVERSGALSWVRVPDPDAATTRTRQQVSGAKRFNGGEGCYRNVGQCSGLQAGGEGPRWEGCRARAVP